MIDAVFALAYHHDERAKRELSSDHESVSVRAELRGPELGEPAPGGLALRVTVTTVRRGEEREVSEESVGFHIDIGDQRLLALDLALAELALTRSGFARLIGELEAWCYDRIPIGREP